jgi:hypothetical protein
MGGAEAPLDPAETVAGMIALLERVGPGDSGKFHRIRRPAATLVTGPHTLMKTPRR